MLQGVVGREASAFHFCHGFAPFAHDFFRTRDDGPANTPTRCHVCLGQPIERDHGDLSINRSNRRWSFSGEHKLVVDFVGKQHGARGFASGNNVFKNPSGGHRAGGIVGVDEHQGLGRCRKQTGDFINIRLPIVGFVQVVGDGDRIEFGQDGGVERVPRSWDQDSISGIHQRREGNFNGLRTAAGDGNVLDGFGPSGLGVLPDGRKGGRGAIGGGVTVQIVVDGSDGRFRHCGRRRKSINIGVANIEVQKVKPTGFCFVGKGQDIPDRVFDVLGPFGGGDGGGRHEPLLSPRGPADTTPVPRRSC